MEKGSEADERNQGTGRGWVLGVLCNERGSFLERWGREGESVRGSTLTETAHPGQAP